jgi:plastin-1
MLSISDPQLGSGLYLLHLCDSITPGVVDWEVVTTGASDEERQLNAKYLLSVGRKMGCAIFLLWEDVVEV